MRFVLVVLLLITGCYVSDSGSDGKVRLAVLSTSAAKVLAAVGAADRIVAVNIYVPRDPLLKAVLSPMPSSVGTASNPSLEMIAAAKADVIITWNTRTVELLRRHFGSRVQLFRVESFNYLRRAVVDFGHRFGSPQKAKVVLSAMDDVLQLVKSRIKGCRRKRAVFCFSDPSRVKGGLGIIDEMMRVAGLDNIAARFEKEYVTLGREALVEADPEVVFIWDWARYSEKDFSSLFPMLKAVKEGRVMKFPPHTPLWAPDSVLTVLRMAMFAYPDRFLGVDYSEVADRFLRKVYGISLGELEKR